MKNSLLPDINPALYTRWFIEKDAKIFRLTVASTLCAGTRDNFTIISYFLKYDHLKMLQEMSFQRMTELINTKVMKPDCNEEGSMLASEEIIQGILTDLNLKLNSSESLG